MANRDKSFKAKWFTFDTLDWVIMHVTSGDQFNARRAATLICGFRFDKASRPSISAYLRLSIWQGRARVWKWESHRVRVWRLFGCCWGLALVDDHGSWDLTTSIGWSISFPGNRSRRLRLTNDASSRWKYFSMAPSKRWTFDFDKLKAHSGS